MRAVRLEAVGELRVREVEERPPAAPELVVRVEACGICGTDRHILRGEYPARLPVTLGHEFAGEVVAAGAEAALPVGTRVAVDPDIFARELRIVGSYLNPLTHGRAVELVASGRLALAPLVTRRLALEEVPAVLASPPEPGDVKAMVMP